MKKILNYLRELILITIFANIFVTKFSNSSANVTYPEIRKKKHATAATILLGNFIILVFIVSIFASWINKTKEREESKEDGAK